MYFNFVIIALVVDSGRTYIICILLHYIRSEWKKLHGISCTLHILSPENISSHQGQGHILSSALQATQLVLTHIIVTKEDK